MNQKEKLICCHDGSLAPMIAVMNDKQKWDIFGISEVYGMGLGEYKKKLFNYDFDDIVLLNSFQGISYLCLLKSNKWGLIEIRDNSTIECEWNIISNYCEENLDSLLKQKGIIREKFSEI